MVNFVTLHVIKFTINYMEALTFDTTEKILLAATGVLFVIQILYYFCLYNRIPVSYTHLTLPTILRV